MADMMNQKNYTNMINALYIFATKLDGLSTDLQTNVNICRERLGSEDASIGPICTAMNKIDMAYLKLAKRALTIAKDMEEEIGSAKNKTSTIWTGEE